LCCHYTTATMNDAVTSAYVFPREDSNPYRRGQNPQSYRLHHRGMCLASQGGFEPPPTGSEPVVLPVTPPGNETSLRARRRIRTDTCTAFETDASAIGLHGLGAVDRIRTCTGRALDPLPLPVGLRQHGAWRGIRTLTVTLLKRVPLPSWDTQAWSGWPDSNRHPHGPKPCALPLSYNQLVG
jgi:hypothetical protein